jgi:prolipoprotein diacylglyceryltransferase
VAWYTFARFFLELLRVDPAKEFGPLRLNAWVSIVVFVCALAAFAWTQRRNVQPKRPGRRAEPAIPLGPKMAVPKGRVRRGR